MRINCNRIVTPSIAVALIVGLGACSCDAEKSADQSSEAVAAPKAEAPVEHPIKALPEKVEVNDDKVALGRSLYFDTRLSGDGTIACATCHSFEHGGAEPRKTSTGIGGAIGPINSPTVLNAGFNFVQFWDGRAADLKAQAAGPVANPIEMGANWDEVVKVLGEDAALKAKFDALYEDGVTQDNVTDAIAEFEKSLVTPSRFDDYLRGMEDALTVEELAGYATFREVGCPTCHNGVNAGGNSYQKMGLISDYFAARGGEKTEADMGRFNVTKAEADRHFFKVPTLRNVELTSPYLHDGSEETLAGVVKVMGKFQLGRELTDEQVTSIVAFLKTLTGRPPEHASAPTPES